MEVASPSRWPATPRWADKRERAHAALRRAKRQAANQLFRVRVSCTAVGGPTRRSSRHTTRPYSRSHLPPHTYPGSYALTLLSRTGAL